MPRPFVDNLQLLRLLAASAVLVSHAASRFVPEDGPFWRVPWVAGVDLFFVISGFVMALLAHGRWGRPGAAGAFMVRRIVRIVPAYWFFTLLLAAAALIAGGQIDGSRATFSGLLTSLFFVPWPRPSDGEIVPLLAQGWTLNYEMFFYLAVALALRLRSGPKWLVGGFVLLAASASFWPAHWWVARFYANPIILEFVVGMALGWLYLAGVRIGRLAAVGLCVAALAWLLFAPAALHEAGRFLWFGPAAALAVAGAVLVRSGRPRRIKRAAMLGGDASYALYLSHPFVIGVGVRLLPELGIGPWSSFALTVVAALAFALLFHLLVERPATDRLRLLAAA